jgi:hypothetical protein
MGVQFDRILDDFDGPFEKVDDFAKPRSLGLVLLGGLVGNVNRFGYTIGREQNDSVTVVNRLLRSGEDVLWLSRGGCATCRDFFYVPEKASTRQAIESLATELGVPAGRVQNASVTTAAPLKLPRIGLYDQYGGLMPSGWTRLILEQFEFPYTVVYPPDLDKGNLHASYDVLVFNGGGLAAGGGGRGGGGAGGAGGGAGGRGGRAGFTPQPIPEQYARMQGAVSAQTLQQIKQFVLDGGTVIAIGNATTGAAQLFDLPLTNHLVENGAPLPREKFYVPGAVLQLSLDNKNPLAYGMGNQADVFFDNDPVFTLGADAAAKGVRPVGWFASPSPLRSGWAWGAPYLFKGVEIVEATVGQGRVLLYAPEILFRSQPHGTFKLFFNGLYLSVTPGVKAGSQ